MNNVPQKKSSEAIHVIRVGGRGYGKSEHARKLLGLSPEDYIKYCKQTRELIERERKLRERMNEIHRGSLLYYFSGGH